MAETLKNGRGSGLVRFLEWAAEKGLIKPRTAAARRSAVVEILAVLDDEGLNVNIATLDIDEALVRFENLHSAKYTPDSLKAYRSRFRGAVRDYLAYLEDPAAFRTNVKTRASSGSGKPAARRKPKPASKKAVRRPGSGASASSGSGAVTSGHSDNDTDTHGSRPGRLIDYPFPLRRDLIALIRLPMNLTEEEAERVGAFVASLAMPLEMPF